MLILLLVACAPEPPSSYAGCAVDTVVTGPTGTVDSTRVETYDADGHLVVDTRDFGDGVEHAEMTWADGCLVRQDVLHTDEASTRRRTVELTCDEHGDRTRVQAVAVESFDDGLVESGAWGETYVNRHDDDGRLVHVRVDDDGDSGRHAELAYAWGACDDPVVSTVVNDAGTSEETTVTCRGDGQPLVSEKRWFDAEGHHIETMRTLHTYDARGRWITRASDRGEGTGVDLEYTATWGPGAEPGPAAVVERRGAELDLTQTSTYTYACGG